MFNLKFGVVPAITMTLAALMALSGCGGGGGGPSTATSINRGGGVGGGAARSPWTCSGSAGKFCVTTAGAVDTASQITAAANNRRESTGSNLPVLGGPYLTIVHAGYQPSTANIDVSKKTTGPIRYKLQFLVDSGDHSAFSANYEANIRLDTGRSTWALAGQPVDSVTRGTVEGYHSARISTKLYDASGDKQNSVLTGVIYTDYDTTIDANNDGTPEADTDYLAIGIWAAEDVDAADTPGTNASHAFALAKGKNPSKKAYIAQISNDTSPEVALGAVNYSGFVAGKHVLDGKARDFTSTVFLTANFDDSLTGVDKTKDEYGLISGEIELGSAGTLKLQSSKITASTNANGFAGNTQLVGTDGNPVNGFTGTYDGAFFGSEDTAGPPSTAGTFGASNTGNTESYVGAFIAKR